MGHGGAHRLEMAALTCFINFHFINSLLQSFNTQFSRQYESGWTGEPETALSRADTLSNAVKTKSVTHEMYITSDKIVLRWEAAPSRLIALCLKHRRRECTCTAAAKLSMCLKVRAKTGRWTERANRKWHIYNANFKIQLWSRTCDINSIGARRERTLRCNEI